jgi:hypothetical protein
VCPLPGDEQFAVGRFRHRVEVHVIVEHFPGTPGRAAVGGFVERSISADCVALGGTFEPDVEKRLLIVWREMRLLPGFAPIQRAQDHGIVSYGPAALRVMEVQRGERGLARCLGAPPSGAVIVGNENVAALARRDRPAVRPNAVEH